MTEVSTKRETELDTFALREHEARASLRSWLAMNPRYTYQSFLDRLPEPTDKSTVSIWLSGRLNAENSRKARLLMEAAEELMVAPIGDMAIVEGRYDREPIDDDDRYLMNLVHELRSLSRSLCERFPVRLVNMAGKFAVPARNLMARDRTAGCGNVLAYMHNGVEYATATNISEPALRLAIQRSRMLLDAGLGAFNEYGGKDKEFARAKFLNYDGSLRARCAIVLRDEEALDDAMATLIESLDLPSRAMDGVHVNAVEVLDSALASDMSSAAQWCETVAARARNGERNPRLIAQALSHRDVPRLRDHWKQTASDVTGMECSS